MKRTRSETSAAAATPSSNNSEDTKSEENSTAASTAAAQNRHVEELYRNQKLLLVLDIDNTLLESCNDTGLLYLFQNDPKVTQTLSKLSGFSSFSIAMHPPSSSSSSSAAAAAATTTTTQKQKSTYLIKLRDGSQTFVQEMMQFFEVYIYTKGVRTYAHTAMNLLAPGGFPTKRIFARDDEIAKDPNAGPDVKVLQYLFTSESMQAMTIVVDDRADVWSRHRGQLAWAWPFKFFVPRGKVKKPKDIKPGEPLFDPSNQKVISEWCAYVEALPEDNVLSNLSRVLKLVHQQFFARSNLLLIRPPSAHKHVDALLQRVKQSVLQGQHIVFSGLFPLHEHQQPSDLAQELWTLAKEFGAECSKDMVPHVTHVVGARSGSEKMHKASQMSGVYVVHYSWLQYSAAHYNRADEYEFSFNENRWEKFLSTGRMGYHASLTMQGLADQVRKLDSKESTSLPLIAPPPLPSSLSAVPSSISSDLRPSSSPSKPSKKKKSMQKWAQKMGTDATKTNDVTETKLATKNIDGKSKTSKNGSPRLGSINSTVTKANILNAENGAVENGNHAVENGNHAVVVDSTVTSPKGWRPGGGRKRANNSPSPSVLLTASSSPVLPLSESTQPQSQLSSEARKPSPPRKTVSSLTQLKRSTSSSPSLTARTSPKNAKVASPRLHPLSYSKPSLKRTQVVQPIIVKPALASSPLSESEEGEISEG